MKLQSFTLMETIIALIIGSIVMLITLTIYQIITREFNSYYKRQFVMNEVYLLKKQMQTLMTESDYVTDSSGGRILNFSHRQGSISFLVDSNYITRKNQIGITDTFHLGSVKQVIAYADSQRNLIKNYTLFLNVENEVIPLFFSKRYSAKQMMEAEEKINGNDED